MITDATREMDLIPGSDEFSNPRFMLPFRNGVVEILGDEMMCHYSNELMTEPVPQILPLGVRALRKLT
jgi:hypothetical protein